jgi:hypothetical protein
MKLMFGGLVRNPSPRWRTPGRTETFQGLTYPTTFGRMAIGSLNLVGWCETPLSMRGIVVRSEYITGSIESLTPERMVI